MKIIKYIILCLLFAGCNNSKPARSLASQTNGPIYLKTNTQAFNFTHEFRLIDGLIYNRQKGDTNWQLLDDIGLPSGEFTSPQSIQDIYAEGEALYAVGNNNHIYQLMQGKAWDYKFGLPAPAISIIAPIIIPYNYKKFVGSQRGAFNLYYDDFVKNQFHYGSTGCTSFLVLDGNGRNIFLGDPWFPPDLSRQVCGPKRNTFKAENIAVAASHIFIISEHGEMYTRFYDYDVNGGTPFFPYSYDTSLPLHGIPGTVKASEMETRILPKSDDMDWTHQPNIMLQGQAQISKQISIIQTGHGNQARELRVEGTDENGISGYYTKNLTERQWHFIHTHHEINPEDFIDSDSSANSFPFEPQDLSFSGEFNRNKTEIAKVEIDDFNFFCSPITLKFTLKNGHQFELLMHTVDSWTTFPEENIWHSDFAIKKLKGTLEIPSSVRHDKKLSKLVKKYFAPFHLKSFKFSILATKKFVEIRKIGYPINNPFRKIHIYLTNGSRNPKTFDYFSKKVAAQTEKLTLPDQRSSDHEIVKYINSLGKLYGEIKAIRKDLRTRLFKTNVLKVGGPLGTSVAKFLMGAVGIFYDLAHDGKRAVSAMETHLGPILHNQKMANKILLNGSKDDYKMTSKQLTSSACLLLKDLKTRNHTDSEYIIQKKYPELELEWLKKTSKPSKEKAITTYCFSR